MTKYAPRAGSVLTVTKFATAQKESSAMPCQERAYVLREEPAGVATDSVQREHMDASVSTNANALVDPVVIQSAVNVSALREGLELGVRRPVSKERLEKSVEVAVTVTLALVAIRSAGGVFVQKGRLGTNVTQFVQKVHMVTGVLNGVAVLRMHDVIQWKGPVNVLREGLGNTAKRCALKTPTEPIVVSGAIASTAHVLLIPENASVRLEQRERDVMKLAPKVTLDRIAVSRVVVMETHHAIL